MALTTLVGSDGGFTTLSGYNGTYFSWEAEFSQPVTETTGYTDTFRAYRGGIIGATFSATGMPRADAATTAPMPDSTDTLALTKTPAAITLTVFTGCTFGGSAIIASTRLSTDLRTNETSLTQSGNFSGTITQTWDES
jgi:hypothetical protein